MRPIKKLAFVVNPDKAGASGLGRELISIARGLGVRVKSTSRVSVPRGYLRGCDACCVIGGDGTLLGVGTEAARAQVPIIGVNRGSLGFLTTFSADEARASLEKLLRGEYRLDYRAMLSCSTGSGPPQLALNDVLVKDVVSSRLIRLEVHAGRELVTDYLCDGLIFSTPTGSTAYNLSAGGPIIHPGARVIAMTPICPHTLSNRAVIFQEGVRLEVVNTTPSARVLVSLDGQRGLKVVAGAPVRISIARLRLPLVQRLDYSHFSIVRTKLEWSGGLAAEKK